MNNNDTIKALTPIVNSYFRDELPAESALDLIGRILRENSAATGAANAGSNGREL